MSEMPSHTQVYRKFASVLDRSIYEPLPDDWIVGMTDVVGSTEAIRQGRYEDVNFLGASIIASIGNAIGSFDFPFSFGGDGATFALPPEYHAKAAAALKQIVALSENGFGLAMRAGIIPLQEIRKNGRDVTIARYAVSTDATYYMFAGGGVRWAEKQLKEGKFSVGRSEGQTTAPNLSGLSCEWNPFESRRGVILSLLVEPLETTTDLAFSQIARQIIQVFEGGDGNASPVPERVPTRKDGRATIDHRTWAVVASNSDYRKFDDVLRLTVDCTLREVEQIEAILRSAVTSSLVRYGLHRQSHAIMTCLVPGGGEDSHLHFLDGADGGYARAAAMMRLNG
jgi:hypothetical protein